MLIPLYDELIHKDDLAFYPNNKLIELHESDAFLFSTFSLTFSPKNNSVWNVVPTHWTFSEHLGHMLAFHSMFLRHCRLCNCTGAADALLSHPYSRDTP